MSAASSCRHQILYVDDEAPLLELGKIFLERSGNLIVDTTEHPEEALEYAVLSRYDAIISDYQMPGMDGITLLKRIRTAGSTIPFIIFTGRGREEVVIEALNSGADFYLQKGGDPKSQFAELSNTIQHAISKKEAEKEIQRRLLFEKVVARISSRFVAGSDVDLAINEALGDIGIFCGASRSYIFLYREEKEEMDNTHEWCADGVPPEIDNLKGLSCSLFPWWMERLLKNENIRIRSLSELPSEASSEKDILEPQGIESLIVLPLIIRQELGGFIGFDNVESTRDWTEEDVALLRITSDLIGNAVEKKKADDQLQEKTLEIQASYEQLLAIEEEIRQQFDEISTAYELLRKSEELYRNVIETQTDLICRSGADGTITFANRAYSNYYGIPEDELIGSRFAPGIPEDERGRLTNHFRSLTPKQPEAVIEHRVSMPDGSVRWQRWSNRAFFDEQGRLHEYQSVGQDCTLIKEAELAVLESESMYRALFEHTAAATVIIEADTSLSLVNPAFETLSGYTADEILMRRMSWTAFFHPDDLERMMEYHRARRIRGKKAPGMYECRFIDRAGSEKDILLHVGMVKGTERSVASLLEIGFRK
ncbi:PAS domain S-box protein [Methanocalculus sp.]|uniref:PAS domain S-box protein n=1 Tax=Methanocalculus sp. TaxID=2004547 RepID=UPI0027183C2E|nr:PAS domain S-box protein [Methanocalculus sp.]MDO8842377.1 PAS domain S-box protein [Methanocalculus sp.]